MITGHVTAIGDIVSKWRSSRTSDAACSDDSYLDMIKRESNDTCNNLFMN